MSQDSIGSVLAIVVIGAGAAIWVRSQLKRKRARAWPVTMGQVESTAVRLEGSGTDRARHIGEVVYSYRVQGQSYSGRLCRGFVLEGRAKKWLGEYLTGRPVSIRYNPENVSDSMMFEDEQAGARAA